MYHLREIVKEQTSKSPLGILFYAKIRGVLEKIDLMRYTDEMSLKKKYSIRFGHEIDLVNPKTYTEKLQWLKLFYRDDKISTCTDKYKVHEYLSKLGYNHLLNEILGVYENGNDIDFDDLPNRFVIKTTHGCGWNLICKDKEKLNQKKWERWKKIMNTWLKLNIYVFGREWNYEKLTPRIIIEKFIDHEPLIDYKFMCFNGEPKYLQINNEFEGEQYVDFYDINWNKVDFTYKKFKQSNRVIPKPELFKEMKELAQKLSAPFPYVRVDFFNPPKKIIFGELTFFPGSGLLPLVPVKNNYDHLLGSQLDLPKPNYNLDLFKKYAPK